MDEFRKYIREDATVKDIKDPVPDHRTKEEILNDLLHDSHIDLSKEYIEPPPYLSIKEEHGNNVTTIFTPGNISAITGKAKAKKSFLQNMFIAATTMNGTIQNRIIAQLPKGKETVLVFDTEQSIYAVYKVADRVRHLTMGNNKNLAVFCLRGLDAIEVKDLIEHALNFFNDVGMIFIDQVADLARSINDEKEAVKIVRWLEKLSKDNDLHICCVIHQNKGDNFASGWLGSQIMKKAETVLSVEKEPQNRDISHVKPEQSRGREFDEFSIMINEQGMPQIISSDIVEQYNTNMRI